MKRKRIFCILLALTLLPFSTLAEGTHNDTLRLELQGDVDSSGDITTTDARLILQYAVGKVTEADVNARLADVDGDGTITSTDARLALQHTVGKDGVLLSPCSLPYTKSEAAPAGEPVPFTVGQITGPLIAPGDVLLADIDPRENGRDDRFVLVQTAEEWAQLTGWHPLAPACEEAFFEENALLLCQVLMYDYGCELQVEAITRNGTTLECHLITHRLPIMAAEAEYWARGVVEIPQSALAGADTLAVTKRYTSGALE